MKKQQDFSFWQNYSLRILFFSFLFFLLPGQTWAEPGIDVRLNATQIPLNKAAMLSITLRDAGKGELHVPELEGVQLQKRGTSRQFSTINGTTTTAVTYRYLLQGQKEGNYTLPPVTFKGRGATLQSQPVDFTILPPQVVNSSPQNPGQSEEGEKSEQAENISVADLAVLQVAIASEAYSGESVPIEIKAFFNTEAKIEPGSITLPQIQGDGVILGTLQAEPKQSREEFNGKVWNTLTWRTSLSAIKEGGHPITVTMDATALIRQTSKTSRSRIRDPLDSFLGGSNPFDDPFFDRMFTRYAEKPLHLTWKELLTVHPLPAENRPDDFHGAVGEFDLAVATRLKDIEMGEPILLTMTVNGAGNFSKIDAPVLPKSEKWKTYPPKVHFEPFGNMGGGQKIFEQAVVITDPHVKEIPALSICYFDPEKEEYVTKHSRPISVNVTSPDGVQTAVVLEKQEEDKKKDILSPNTFTQPLKIELGPLGEELRPLPQRLWFQIIVIFFLVVSLGAMLFRYDRKRRKRSARCLSRQALYRLREDLITVRAAQENGDDRLFLSASRVAIQNSLANRCGIHPSAISLADLRRVLSNSSPLIEIFHLTDQASYGGGISSMELDKLYSQLKSELEKLI